MYGLDKVIEEIKSRCSDFDVDKAMKHAGMIKKGAKLPHKPEGEGMMVVEVSAEPVDGVEKFGVPETPELPGEEEVKICPECGKDPCECEKDTTDTVKDTDKSDVEDEEEDKSVADGMEAITETKMDLEDPTPSEEDRMQKILDAIKTFFPNEKTEDVLVRIVSKLIDR